MSTACEFFRDDLVDLAAGALPGDRRSRLEDHLGGCAGCREELQLVQALRAAPPVPADGLEARVRAAVREARADPRPAPRSGFVRGRALDWRRWGVPLAAAAALAAVWVGVDRRGSEPLPAELETVAAEYEPFGAWPAADGEVAGVPVLEELSVEELEQLLEEMR